MRYWPFPTALANCISTPGAPGVTDLPAGSINHHWTKNILASPDGRYLYATTGSNSNVGENGLAAEEGRAAIWQIDLANGTKRLYATGLRNPNGMAWEASTGMLWTVANERDELGNDLVPDYLTSVRDSRVLRLAIQLLRAARGQARQAAEPGAGRGSAGARLRPGRACCRTGSGCCGIFLAASAIQVRHVRRGSTARGTASRWPVTRSCSWPLKEAHPRACPSMY